MAEEVSAITQENQDWSDIECLSIDLTKSPKKSILVKEPEEAVRVKCRLKKF